MLKKCKKLIRLLQKKGIIEGLKIAVGSIIRKAKGRIKKLSLIYLKLRSKNGLVLREIQGSKMYLDVFDPGISKELLSSGSHEDLATKVLRQEVKGGMAVVDIGSNLGYYALIEASAVGEKGQVYALEPVPRNFTILSKNIEVNGYKNIKAYCKALSDRKGISQITLTDATNWGCMLDIKTAAISEYMKQKMHRLTKKTIKVDTVSLDEFLDMEGVRQPNFIRMDIEGYEVKVIKGMSNTLRDAPPPLKLFFEIHNKVFDNPEAIIGLLAFDFKPKFIILPEEILPYTSRGDFVKKVCSYRSECPHVVLEK